MLAWKVRTIATRTFRQLLRNVAIIQYTNNESNIIPFIIFTIKNGAINP